MTEFATTDEIIATASGRVADVLYEDTLLTSLGHVVACRQLGLDPTRTVIGGNQSDSFENSKQGMYTLQEDDPRHNEYWEYLARYWVKVLSQATATSAGTLLH